jgi:hypothetical protein
MKKGILITLNAIALACAIAWYVKSNFEYEPLIAIITLIVTLLGLLLLSDRKKIANIKGNDNFTQQKSEQVVANVEGDNNQTYQ